jgi:hypothetical protein
MYILEDAVMNAVIDVYVTTCNRYAHLPTVQDGSVLKISPSTASASSKQLQHGVTDADKVKCRT